MEKELLRHNEFAKIALNADEAIEVIRPIAALYKINLDELSDEYIRDLDHPRY